VTLTDTGPLVALVNRNDPNHFICVAAARQLPAGPLVTTWPSFTEAMYLLHRAGGYPAQEVLWLLRAGGKLELRDVTEDEMQRMSEMMFKYKDLPMDLADASLIAAAEQIGTRTIFTIDKDFHIYRFADGTPVTVIP